METLSATIQTKAAAAEARLAGRAERALARALAAAILMKEASEGAEDEEMLELVWPEGGSRPWVAACMSRTMTAAACNADNARALLESECLHDVRRMADRMLVAARAALGIRG